MIDNQHQELPTNRSERERLRDRGQFWTPDWIASAMVQYVLANNVKIFDPAVGKGAFFNALRNTLCKENLFYGIDNDKSIINYWKPLNVEVYNCKIEYRDFIFNSPTETFGAIVANPPYIRHHRLSYELKGALQKICIKHLGYKIDARAGLHIYFLIQALGLLQKNGKLAFIMPSDTCEGVFAKKLWAWIAKNFMIEAVITFAHDATPFPGVDVNPIVFFIKNTNPKNNFLWIKVLKPQINELLTLVKSNFTNNCTNAIEVYQREIEEGIATGLTRIPTNVGIYKYHLHCFAKVKRGIATGANDFFFLTANKAKLLKLPDDLLHTAISRTRNIQGFELTSDIVNEIDKKGNPTLLFHLDGRDISTFSESVRQYVNYGEQIGLPRRALIKTRNPWYKMEKRDVPKILFAYLGRRSSRFINNKVGALPLNGFLCVYPYLDDEQFVISLLNVLNHPETLKNLSLIGKSYGSGALKVEPRNLEKLPIPEDIVEEFGLKQENDVIYKPMLF
ncbi:MAG: SAM-dependent methyltransferase [Candidatus Magnetoovum sp. WYHC-5]|nr:SAM-dependent methyltransferase [Candidatus Magnetoovum sp. WYHC-5]